MVVQNLGRVGLVLKGDWSSTTQYEKLDVIAYDGNSWVAKRSNKNVTPNTTNSDDWQLISNNADLVSTVQGYKNDAAASAAAAAASAALGEDAVDAIAPDYSDLTFPVEKGEWCWYNGTLYSANTDIATSESWTAAHWTAVTVGGEVAELKRKKANIDGSYKQMTVGNAEQLVSTVGVEDQAPYNFRTSGGAADIGDREVDKIVGGTIAWNQLLKNGNFATATGWLSNASTHGTITIQDGVLTVTCLDSNSSIGIAQNGFSVSTLAYHKMFFAAYVNPSANTNINFGTSTAAGNYNAPAISVPANIWTQIACIGYMASGNTGRNFLFYVNRNGALSENDTVQIKNIMAIDLTQMFGSTIADYIYSLETATAGAGVAWFRKLFPKDYYAYNAGELMSVQAASHKMVGFNQWDEEWEVGGISTSNGGNINQQRLRSKNFIPLVVGQEYNFHNGPRGNAAIFYYDHNKALVTSGSLGTAENIRFTANYPYMRFVEPNITSYSNNICINLHWDGERDGEYEPYAEHVYDLDPDLELRGIPKLDANNNLYYDGDTYESDGTVTRKYRDILIDGGVNGMSFTGSFGATDYGFAVYINTGLGNRTANAISDKFVAKANSGYASMPLYSFVGTSGANVTWVFILPSSVTTTAEANAWAQNNPFHIMIPVRVQTIESADPYQNPQIVDDFGTEEYVDAGVTASTPTRDVAIPVGHDTHYQSNLRAKLEMAPDSPTNGDGDYIVRQTNGENAYVKLVKELPESPSQDGTYHLKCTVSSGVASYAWIAET